MKRIICLIGLITVLFVTSAYCSTAILAPIAKDDQKRINISVHSYNDIGTRMSRGHASENVLKSNGVCARLGVKVTSWLEPYVTYGHKEVKVNFLNKNGVPYTYKTSLDPIYGGGFKINFGEIEPLGADLFLDASYEYYRADVKELKENNTIVNYTGDKVIEQRTQVALGLNKAIALSHDKLINIYGGVLYRHVSHVVELVSSASGTRFKNKRFGLKYNVGIFAGFEYCFNNMMSFGIEGRAFTDSALNGYVKVKF